ncbi:MAG TPA: UvrD-helicase domain-containing protein [Hypericibacter adhaerens]|jgi:DNA helicase-2/ATP-dependent DNA helicase PcrA|uniref:ATP-dependent helicase n=1 Tax=Hypericibacter adhaerens TaxID=2602016 RepID=UPI002CFB46B3|nr:UvrD-helicase domain-containing protein [Hypericibacter adhaerens]HWA43420.1 UvrD-helicase domain-containing protein [Hypericibacter adhaerens]
MNSDDDSPRPDPRSAPAGARPPLYLSALNESQRAAVEALDGPVLVLAGAGTGKTRVLTTRLAHLLTTGKAGPGDLLAVTFTNKAAREMKDRVAALIGRPVEGWWLGTFHALAARILRSHAEVVGLKPNFTILDTDDQLRLMKQIVQAADIDDKKWPARAVLHQIERWKDRGLGPEKIGIAEAGDFAGGKAPEIYRDYQERLRTLNAVDFGDLLLHNLTIFLSRPEILERYQQRFRYILVDEYQDTNVAQYLWLRLLAQKHRNICCVGDDDQSIYGWRGAEVGNILRFEQDFPGARIVRLERNYRSTQHILRAASDLIAHNDGRLGKTLWTEDEPGEKVILRGLWDGEAEARFVSDEIEAIERRGGSLDQIAILVRAGYQTREFEERFLNAGISYRLVGGPRFYERQEIRDALAYLRLVHQPADDLAFERVVNLPRRGIGDSTMQLLHRFARASEMPLTEAALRLVGTDELKPAAKKALGRFMEDLERWRGFARDLPHTELAERLLDESGYTAMWQNDRSPDAPGRLENLKELVVGMAEFDTLEGFLEHVSLVMENVTSESEAKVTLMTLHSAKGLEFDYVFLPGWEEGVFPHQRALDETGLSGLEEERRLAYVGLTRARKRAWVSYAANRRIHNQWQSLIPSRFVDELPKDAIDRIVDPGLYGAGRYDAGGEPDEWPRNRLGEEGGRGTGGGREFGRYFSGGNAGRGNVARFSPRRDAFARERPPRLIESSSAPSRSGGAFGVGDRVFHLKFGYGKVTAAEGDKLEIEFDKAGTKRVMASFVLPADQAG